MSLDSILCDDVLHHIFSFYGDLGRRVRLFTLVSERWSDIVSMNPMDWKKSTLRNGVKDENIFFNERRDFRRIMIFLKQEVVREADRLPLPESKRFEYRFGTILKSGLVLSILCSIIDVFCPISGLLSFLPLFLYLFSVFSYWFFIYTNDINWSQLYYDFLIILKRNILKVDCDSTAFLPHLDIRKYFERNVEFKVPAPNTNCESKIIRFGNRFLHVRLKGTIRRSRELKVEDDLPMVVSRSLRIGWNGLFPFLGLHRFQSKCSCGKIAKHDYKTKNYLFREIPGRVFGAIDKHTLINRDWDIPHDRSLKERVERKFLWGLLYNEERLYFEKNFPVPVRIWDWEYL